MIIINLYGSSKSYFNISFNVSYFNTLIQIFNNNKIKSKIISIKVTKVTFSFKKVAIVNFSLKSYLNKKVTTSDFNDYVAALDISDVIKFVVPIWLI